MTTHTPGPWTHSNFTRDLGFMVGAEGATGTIVCEQVRTKANARLIAAAPDLLALAHQYASECGDCAGERIDPDDEPCEACADIWRVIDQAEGRA